MKQHKSVDNSLLWISPGRILISAPDFFHDGSIKASGETIPAILHLS